MIWALVIGLIVGAIAKFIMPGKDPGGIIVTMLIGIVGSMLAHWIGMVAGWYTEDQAPGLIASVLGSILLLWLYRVAIGRRATAV